MIICQLEIYLADFGSDKVAEPVEPLDVGLKVPGLLEVPEGGVGLCVLFGEGLHKLLGANVGQALELDVRQLLGQLLGAGTQLGDVGHVERLDVGRGRLRVDALQEFLVVLERRQSVQQVLQQLRHLSANSKLILVLGITGVSRIADLRTPGSMATHCWVSSRTCAITRSSRKSYGKVSVHSANNWTMCLTNCAGDTCKNLRQLGKKLHGLK